MRIEGPIQSAPSTSGTYLPYEEKMEIDPLFGYSEKLLAPWVMKRYKLSINGLHEEILDVYHWLRPRDVETALRFRVFERVKEVILERWKQYDVKVSVFGSLRTQLFLPTSDIDVLVECEAWTDVTPILHETSSALEATGMAESIFVFGEAFVPIVKMVDKDTLVSIDISFNTVQGVRAADYIEKVKHEFPVVEPLILVLKQFLIQRNLNQTYTGGLSSYGLILMLISFLQIYAMPVRSKSFYDEGVNLGELLMRFFEVYAQEFNYLEVGISVEGCCYTKKQKKGNVDFNSPVLSLEDPLLKSNEVGRSTFNFARVQVAFAQALQVLKGVFVNDRIKNDIFNSKVYPGSMLALIMPFTPQQVDYRSWLKVRAESQSLSCAPKTDKSRVPVLLTNTCVSSYINLDTAPWNRADFGVSKAAKPLSIISPEEVNGNDIIVDITSLHVQASQADSDSSVNEKENGADNEMKNPSLPSPRRHREWVTIKGCTANSRKGNESKKGTVVTENNTFASIVHKNVGGKIPESKNEKKQASNTGTPPKNINHLTNGSTEQARSRHRKNDRRLDLSQQEQRSFNKGKPSINGTAITSSDGESSEQDMNGFTTVINRRR